MEDLHDFTSVVRNPLLNRRGRSFKCLIRPVPVVLRRCALVAQLYLRIFASGKPQDAQRFFCRWNARFPQRRQSVCAFLLRLPKLVVPFVYWKVSRWNVRKENGWMDGWMDGSWRIGICKRTILIDPWKFRELAVFAKTRISRDVVLSYEWLCSIIVLISSCFNQYILIRQVFPFYK